MLPIGLCFMGASLFSLVGLQRLSLSTYSVLKRSGVISVMLLEFLFLQRRFSVRVQFSVVIITMGAVLVSAGDLSFDFVGCVCALMAMVCKTFNLIWVARTGQYVSTSGTYML
jgi:solute carrier family 35, member E3